MTLLDEELSNWYSNRFKIFFSRLGVDDIPANDDAADSSEIKLKLFE